MSHMNSELRAHLPVRLQSVLRLKCPLAPLLLCSIGSSSPQTHVPPDQCHSTGLNWPPIHPRWWGAVNQEWGMQEGTENRGCPDVYPAHATSLRERKKMYHLLIWHMFWPVKLSRMFIINHNVVLVIVLTIYFFPFVFGTITTQNAIMLSL